MNISHELKLIFIKTKKVGGRSFEIALSKYCGPGCVITPISLDDVSAVLLNAVARRVDVDANYRPCSAARPSCDFSNGERLFTPIHSGSRL
jgi:hypothetical protein